MPQIKSFLSCPHMFNEMLKRAFIHTFGRLTYVERWGQLVSVGESIVGIQI